MSVAIITGSLGLVGSEASTYFADQGLEVIGIDNDMRQYFFGSEASTKWNKERLESRLGSRYDHHDVDIRHREEIFRIFKRYGKNISLVVHTAAQPSHDWAAKEPFTDFTVNANGTLTLLEATRQFAPEAVFIFVSTNKVYGDKPNRLPLVELSSRWQIEQSHPYSDGIPETMSLDQCLHSLFGASKAAADILVQEYGRYFDMNTACFRAGCITGPSHSGAQLHGFLAYLVKCAASEIPYTVFGYKCKQVRDNIHSADLVQAFDCFFKKPRIAEVYNIGGGYDSNCSMLEAIQFSQKVVGRELKWSYEDTARKGDHIWWISDLSKFKEHYPEWNITYNVPRILKEIYEENRERWRQNHD